MNYWMKLVIYKLYLPNDLLNSFSLELAFQLK